MIELILFDLPNHVGCVAISKQSGVSQLQQDIFRSAYNVDTHAEKNFFLHKITVLYDKCEQSQFSSQISYVTRVYLLVLKQKIFTSIDS